MLRWVWTGLLLLTAAACSAGDWPQWGGVNCRNMVSPAKNLPASFSPGKKLADGGLDFRSLRNVRWVARMGVHTYGNPTVADGRVFVGTNDRRFSDPRIKRDRGGVLICLDERTGRCLWRLHTRRYRPRVYGSRFDDLNVGLCSSPTIDGDRLYVVTNRAEVLCLDVKGMADGNQGPFLKEGAYLAGPRRKPVEIQKGDADILWRFDMMHRLPTAPHDASNCNILLLDGLLYICTSNGVHRMPDQATPLPDAPSLIVLDKKTGALVAKDDERIGRRTFHGQWSSPSAGKVDGQMLVFFGGGDGVMYAFEPPKVTTGKKGDGGRFSAKPVTSCPTRGSEAKTTPVPFFSRPATLKKVWSYDCNPLEFKIDIEGEQIDYWSGDASRARVTKDFKGPSEIIATPVFYRNRVYVAIGRDPVHGKARGILHCIDATGKGDVTKTHRIWSYRGISRSISTVSIADGLLYVADFAGVVHCLDAETGKVHWIHNTRQAIWSSTFVADGKVYVGTQRGMLWIFAAGAKKKIITKIKLPSELSCTPITANGVLYIATGRYLFAVGSPLKNGKGL